MYLYVIGAFDRENSLLAVKIGVSEDVSARIDSMQTGQFCDLRLLTAWESSRAKCFAVERDMHLEFVMQRLRGEWFDQCVSRKIMQVGMDMMGSLPVCPHGMKCHLGAVLSKYHKEKHERGKKRSERREKRREKLLSRQESKSELSSSANV